MKSKRINHHFRHELKFIIGQANAWQLQKRLQSFLQVDAFSLDLETGYRVSSLYFDDYRRSAYFDKLDGSEDRTKYRLRAYNGRPDFITLEAKIKKGDLSRKESWRLTNEQYRNLLMETEGIDWEKEFPNSDSTNYLKILKKTKLMRPQLIVDYQRLALVCPEGNTRLTFDDGLRISHMTPDIFADDDHVWYAVLPSTQMILEIKYDRFLPLYISQLLAGIPLHKIAVSKYVFCQQAARTKNLGFSLKSPQRVKDRKLYE